LDRAQVFMSWTFAFYKFAVTNQIGRCTDENMPEPVKMAYDQ